jgi:hypothetical protein
MGVDVSLSGVGLLGTLMFVIDMAQSCTGEIIEFAWK